MGYDAPGGPPIPRLGPVETAEKKDPWKEVATKVAEGEVRFEPIAAQTAAQECADAIGRIIGLQKAITDMGTLDELSHLLSGRLLATQFNNTLSGLNRVLDGHKATLGNMLETFKAAGKNYIETDLDSSYGFDKQTRAQMIAGLDGIKAPTRATGKFHIKRPKEAKPAENKAEDQEKIVLDDTSPFTGRDFTELKLKKEERIHADEIHPEDLVKPAALPARLSKYTGPNQSQPDALSQWKLETAPQPENPQNQEWRDLYNLRLSTGKAAKKTDDAAKMWKSLAKEMDDTVGKFADKLVNMPDTLWKGKGADKAIGAVKNYHTKADDLITRMEAVSSNLAYTTDWLTNTKIGMPPEPDPPKPKTYTYEGEGGSATYTISDSITNAKNARDLAIYRQNMENNYVWGVQTSSQLIPALNGLPSTTPKDSKVEPSGNERPNGGTGPGTTGPGSTGPGSFGPAAGGPGYTGTGSGPGYTPNSVTSRSAPDLDYTLPSSTGNGTTSPTTPDITDPTIDPSTIPTPTASSPTDSLGQMAGLAQQGMSGLQAAQQAAAMSKMNDGLRPTKLPGLTGGPGAPNASGLKGGGLGGSSPATPVAAPREPDTARLFPRANLAGPASTAAGIGRMGMPVAGAPMAGAPGTPGAAGANPNQGQGKEYKRPNYLDSKDHLEEALGGAPAAVKAVVEK
ncbi:PPE domain-containing protein [Nocardia paucivorans]|uniref:PPE domain-containing protein n=1 Tax=Nocardia paucivorans TaxID=114259 RepID=UPI0002FB523F|nr:hypothetical protein [Nocardia paucivorans]